MRVVPKVRPRRLQPPKQLLTWCPDGSHRARVRKSGRLEDRTGESENSWGLPEALTTSSHDNTGGLHKELVSPPESAPGFVDARGGDPAGPGGAVGLDAALCP